MCGRYTTSLTHEDVEEFFGVPAPGGYRPRGNLAPTQPGLIVRSRDGGLEAAMARWGLVPASFPTVEAASKLSMFNARSETVATSRSFADAYRRRRCLVPATGFYEWRKVGAKKQPYLIGMESGEPIAFAGLWERWERGDEALESYAILTTTPNELVASIHDRMPVVLERSSYDAWLDPDADPEAVGGLLRPYPRAREMDAYPVSPRVGSPRVDEPELALPLAS